jgi:hypothetical protein
MCGIIVVKLFNIKFHENLLSVSKYTATDGRANITKPTGIFKLRCERTLKITIATGRHKWFPSEMTIRQCVYENPY